MPTVVFEGIWLFPVSVGPVPSTRKSYSVVTPLGSVSVTEDEVRVLSVAGVSVMMEPG